MKSSILLLLGVFIVCLAKAQQIHVPGDYPTIQQAIAAANPGDTVLVSDGIYYEQINFLGKKPLMVASQFILDGDTSHISNTIIDGSQLSDPLNASVVYIKSGEDSTSVLKGFKITGGTGTVSSTGGSINLSGGGIFIRAAGPKISNNIISGNSLSNEGFPEVNYVAGAGLYIFNSVARMPIIENNMIKDNSSLATVGMYGGGLYSFGNIRIRNNTIFGNSNTSDTSIAVVVAGGGLCLQDYNPGYINYITGNIIEHNFVSGMNGAGGGVFIDHGGTVNCTGNVIKGNYINGPDPQDYGGGGMAVVQAMNENSEISGNTFINNSSTHDGGGLWLSEINGWFVIENNYFFGNTAKFGGAISTYMTQVTLQNNVFYKNIANMGGGAVYLFGDNPVEKHNSCLLNNSFNGNKVLDPTGSGGALSVAGVNPLILNSVFWQDSAAFTSEIKGNTHFIELAYCNVDAAQISNPAYQVIFGDRILNEDPLFVDSLLRITAGSPCIDMGDDSYACHDTSWTAPLYDITGHMRPFAEYFDIGAYEYDSTQVGIVHPVGSVPGLTVVNYPSPFVNATYFEYTLSNETYIKLTVYNQAGQEIAVLFDGKQNAGWQQISWNAEKLQSGIYFYRMTTSGNQVIKTGKLIKF